jgi:hypothetical protein
MSCEKTKEWLPLYVDGGLTAALTAACDEHLKICPVCRAELSALCTITRELSQLPAAAVPTDLAAAISRRLKVEAAAGLPEHGHPTWRRIGDWILPRVMPYSIGALASVLLFVAMLAALRPHLRALHDAVVASQIESNRTVRGLGNGWDITKPVSPQGLAAERAPFGVESPSLNPRGALATLTLSDAHNHGGDDDMIIVTNVFTDGRASVEDVVQAPRDKKLLTEFQDALRENAAFVPSAYDQRPSTMRVVFVFQKVDVRERKF